MEFFYPSGDVVRPGDRILYAGGGGVVEFVVDPGASSPDPEAQYFVDEFGGGCMLLTERYGRIFLHEPDGDPALALVSRKDA